MVFLQKNEKIYRLLGYFSKLLFQVGLKSKSLDGYGAEPLRLREEKIREK